MRVESDALDQDAATLLRVLLEEARYANVQNLLRRDVLVEPFCGPYSGNWVRRAVSELFELQQVMVRIFTLGSNLPRHEVADILEEDVVDRLIDAGLLVLAGGRVRSRYLIIAYLNRYFLVSPPLWLRGYNPDEPFVYVGSDSYWVAKFVANFGPSERALDLCCGSGILGTLLDSQSVIGVDVDPRVTGVARFNAALNGVDGRLEIRTGNLYDAVQGETFDVVVANPPFLPVPRGLTLPASGNGGEDGDDAVREIVASVVEHLEPGGRLLLYAQGFGDDVEPFVASWLRDALSTSDLGGVLMCAEARSLESAGGVLRRLWQEAGASEEQAFEAWGQFCRDPNMKRHYTYLLDIGLGGLGHLQTQRLLAV
jgi:hypothetical protein